jgi:voltage-gated potassium channel
VEFAFTLVFTLELVIRLLVEASCLRSFADPFTIFDLLAVLPFYVAMFVVDTSVLGYFFFLRIFRLLKVVRHYPGAVILWHSVRKSKDALAVPFAFCIILMNVFSAILFYIEFLDATSTSFSTSWLHDNGQASEAYESGRRPQINSMAKGVRFG